MKATGVEVPAETLSKTIEPNTFIAVISDDKGVTRTIKVNRDSIPEKEAFLNVESGCYVRINGFIIWIDPCPYQVESTE